MLKNSKDYLKLKNKVKRFVNKELVDIVVFGSAVKGKTIPKDIDVCLIFKNNIDLGIVRNISKVLGDNFHVSHLIVDNFFTKMHNLAKSVFFEGVSLITGKKLAEQYSLKSYSLFYYSLSGMKKSDKVRFVYLIKGRGKEKGLVKHFNGLFLVPSCFLVPLEKDSEIIEILNKWKIKFHRKKIMLMD